MVLDEVQRVPSLFEVLRPLADRPGVPARFLLLGSASPDLVRGTSETLAGRALVLHIPGFTLEEVGFNGKMICGYAALSPGPFWPPTRQPVCDGGNPLSTVF